MKKYLLIPVFLFLLWCGAPGIAFSAIVNWKGATSSDWGTGTNWSSGTVPTAIDNVRIGVVAFTNQPVISGNYSCNNLVFGSLQAATLTINATYTLMVGGNMTQDFGAGTAGTGNTTPSTLTFTTVLTGAGTLYCTGNLVIGDGTTPANYAANLYQVSSQITQFTINGNVLLNACGNGSATKNNQNYPALTIDNNEVILNGQIVTSSTGSPTSNYYYTYNPYLRFFQGLGTVSTNNAYSSTNVANTNATTFELTNNNPISGGAAALAAGFYVIFDAQGTGGGSVIYTCSTGPQTIYTASDVPYTNSVYNNLQLTGAGTKTTDAGTLSVGFEGGLFKTSNGTVNFNTNNTVVTDYNDWDNSATSTQGTGTFTISGDINNYAAGTINGSTAAANTTVAGKLNNQGTYTCNAESIAVTGNAPNGGTFTAGSGTISLGGTCVNSGTFTGGTGTITVAGKFTNTGAVTGPTGSGSKITFNGIYLNSSGTFTGSSGYVDFGSVYKLLTGTFTAGSGEVEYDDNYTNAGSYYAGSGLAYFGGKAAQTLLDSSSTTGTVFNNVTFYCKATMNATGSGYFAVSPTGVLTVYDDGTYAAKLTAGDNVVNATTTDSYLTLRSNATSSASVAALTGNTSIKGNVNVQRYITGGSGYRGYRLLSSPVSVYNTAYYSLNYPINNSYVKGTTGTAGGFDASGNPNLYLFRENLVPSNTTFISGNWRGVNAINNATAYNYSFDSESSNYYIYPGQGFLFFFRGSRKVATLASESVTTYIPTNDTLTATGILNQGAVSAKYWYTGSTSLGYTSVTSPAPGNGAVIGFNCVGNPYACTIDLNTASTTAGSGITISASLETNFYELNPQTQNYDVWSVSLNNGNNDATRYIASGQGFFARADAAGQTITFNEAAKNTSAQNVNPYLFMAKREDGVAAAASARFKTADSAGATPFLRIKAMLDDNNRDDILFAFNPNASANYVVNEDAVYRRGNGNVNLSAMSADSVPLAIDQMPFPKLKPAVIPLRIWAAKDGTYTFKMTDIKQVPDLYDVWLMDAYRKDSLDIKHNPAYLFDLANADTNTYGAHRFTLVIRENPGLMVHLLSFSGAKATGGDLINWTVENEANYTSFALERSTNNGATFTALESITSNAAGAYNYLDNNPVNGANQYRLKMTDLNGTVTYSAVVIIMYENNNNNIAINGLMLYPNPTAGTINLNIDQTTTQTGVAPSYRIQILNSTGAIVKSATSAQPSWQSDVSVMAPGTYFISVVNANNNSVVGKGAFVKL